MQQTSGAGGETPEDPDLVGTVIAGRYRVVRKLGEGGMGAVYHAVHEALRKPVALKLLAGTNGNNKEIVARFEREAIASANLRHPNIAEASDFGRLPDGTLYLVMEYIDGKTLRALLEGSPAGLPAERVVAILRQVAAALGRAHAQDVVHRDLKPENVIVFDRTDKRDVVKVIDFGIARIRSAALGGGGTAITVAGSVFGTPEYMAPEQVMGQPADARADQYAFGVLAFELLTGRVPFSETDVTRLLMKHISAPIPSARDTAPHLPPAVNAVLARLLSKKPDDRYPTIGEAFDALEAAFAPPASSGASSGTMLIGAGPAQGLAARAPAPAPASAPVDASPAPVDAASAPAYMPAHLSAEPAVSASTVKMPRKATVRVRIPFVSAETFAKNPLLYGGILLGAVLLLLLVVSLVGLAVGSSVPSEVQDALDDWDDGAYAEAAPKLRAALAKNGSLATDADVARRLARAIPREDGRRALQRLLDDTAFGRSAVMATTLAEIGLGEPSAERNGALKLLRGRQDLLPADQRARVLYRDADDCAAMQVALAELAAVTAEPARKDIEAHRQGECPKIVRREELCACRASPPARGKGKK